MLTKHAEYSKASFKLKYHKEIFNLVAVAAGYYCAPYVLYFPGLFDLDTSSQVKTIYNSIGKSSHSFYRRYFKLKEELFKFAPKNVQQVGNIKAFRFDNYQKLQHIQDAVVELEDGARLTELDYIYICIGYVFSFLFLKKPSF
ncbi:hypothetical protein INT46_011867 [Mucor plumbeus]|uniref:Uncharacterized protein n=1 Tax=Mucor plumbeus TaxID=97098 RepID=A0A8H7R0W4_9FUNG|nr:hypothetical protein INT46_011867 [Mucor plumbeus]